MAVGAGFSLRIFRQSARCARLVAVYNARNQLTGISQSGAQGSLSTTYQYDPQGNQIQKARDGQITAFTYDAHDQLIQISRNGSVLGTYRNNHLGLRIEKEAKDPLNPQGPPVRLRTLWDGHSAVMDRSTDNTGADNVIARYDFAGREPIGLWHKQDGAQALHSDALGSVVLTTDTAGAAQAETLFDAWGNPIVEAGQSANKFGYTGHQMDDESGLIYAQARYYDPETGRFLTLDPAEANPDLPLTYNSYLYAYGNPTVWIDPDGRESVSTMIDNAAEGCGPWSCAGYALLKGAYIVGSMGFASVHDPVRDAYDEGKISGARYVGTGVVGGVAVVGVNALTGRMGGALLGGAASVGTKAAIGAGAGAVSAAASDGIEQASHIAAGVQQDYDPSRTVSAAATGAVLGGVLTAAGVKARPLTKRTPQSKPLVLRRQKLLAYRVLVQTLPSRRSR